MNSRCNECNEALDGARQVIDIARRLAMVATSALLNGDSHRTREVLNQLQSALASHDVRAQSENASERLLR